MPTFGPAIIWHPAVGTFGWQNTGLTPSGATGILCDMIRWFAPMIPQQLQKPNGY